MAEYIERDSAAAFAYECGAVYVSNRLSNKNAFPSADVAPVVHGRWIGAPLCGNDNCKCSECGSWHNIHANLRGKITQKYCPNCGARMDGGSENG